MPPTRALLRRILSTISAASFRLVAVFVHAVVISSTITTAGFQDPSKTFYYIHSQRIMCLRHCTSATRTITYNRCVIFRSMLRVWGYRFSAVWKSRYEVQKYVQYLNRQVQPQTSSSRQYYRCEYL